jgi:2-methylcitrate dehydratase PrpD
VTGQDFITALALGQDIFTRLRTSVAWKQNWFLTPVLGTLASAAACAKLLGLPQEKIVNALGIACCQSAGTMQLAFGTGGDLRGIYAGFGAKAGLFSALLAQAGVTGTTTPLNGEAGFLKVYFEDDWDRETMLGGLGQEFRGSTTIFKMWPCTANTHGFIDTALRLMGSHGRMDEIEKLVIHGGDFAKRLIEPVELRRHPTTANDAKFSISYTVAVALVRGTVGVGDFSEERRKDPIVAAMADKIEFVNESVYDWTQALPSGAVSVVLKNGATLFGEWQHDEVPGATGRPLDWAQLVAKFEDCASFGAKPIDRDSVRAIVRTVADLENLSDVSAVVEHTG